MTIPTPAAGIIGRDAEILYARSLLRRHDVRLLTLTGAGGVGKTRLAIEIARQVTSDYQDGAFFVPIASITDPLLVLPAIASTLGLSSGVTPESMGAELGERDLLVVLDNFEQVEDAAPLVAGLLQAAPGLQIMVTSRSLLRLSGEHQLQVVPLAAPGHSRLPPLPQLAAIPAVELFTTRAMAATRSFQLTESNAAEVALVCSRLDGLPLAIELATARLRHLPLAAIVARLDRPLDFLIDGPRDAPPRLRTLRDAITWSYSLLPPQEQTLMRRLAVFHGGFTLEAAQQVVGRDSPLSTLAGISSLVDSSLLVQLDNNSTAPRFGMLETIREFAQEQLLLSGELEGIRQLHGAYFLEVAEAANDAMEGPKYGAWVRRLREDRENLRAANRNALEAKQTETALRLSLELWGFWSSGEHAAEARRWMEQAVAMSDGMTSRPRGRGLTNLGNLALTLFDLHAAERHYRDALVFWETYGTPDDIAVAELGLGVVARLQGRYTDSQAHVENVLAVWTAADDISSMAIAEHGIATALSESGNVARSRVHYERSLDFRKKAGDTSGLAYTLISSGAAERWAGDRIAALAAVSEAVAHFQELQSNDGLLLAYLQLARLAADIGNDAEALDFLQQSFVLLQTHMRAKGVIEALETLAAILVRRRLALPAASLLSAATVHRQTRSLVVPVLERTAVTDTRSAIANMLGVTAFSSAWSEGQSLSLEQAVARALHAVNDPLQAASGGPAYDLTRRELEVLALLAEHLSDREIADRLFLSPRTIERHVSNILLKMEAPNRRLAAAQAVRERLVTASP
ncbi:MAG: tetratricopeptide repeat protein [Chloroflexota bacterium]|nr:tetratricopeptide repeat protein [Chloroflexota bacterium]